MNSNNRGNSKIYQKDTEALRQVKLEKEIIAMGSEELLSALKAKSLPVYGTTQQKRDRLRAHYGFIAQPSSTVKAEPTPKVKSKKENTLAAIDKINKNRENRRKKMEEKKKIKLQKEVDNQEQGIKCDVDFQLMVEYEKSKVTAPEPHKIPDLSKINI